MESVLLTFDCLALRESACKEGDIYSKLAHSQLLVEIRRHFWDGVTRFSVLMSHVRRLQKQARLKTVIPLYQSQWHRCID